MAIQGTGDNNAFVNFGAAITADLDFNHEETWSFGVIATPLGLGNQATWVGAYADPPASRLMAIENNTSAGLRVRYANGTKIDRVGGLTVGVPFGAIVSCNGVPGGPPGDAEANCYTYDYGTNTFGDELFTLGNGSTRNRLSEMWVLARDQSSRIPFPGNVCEIFFLNRNMTATEAQHYFRRPPEALRLCRGNDLLWYVKGLSDTAGDYIDFSNSGYNGTPVSANVTTVDGPALVMEESALMSPVPGIVGPPPTFEPQWALPTFQRYAA